KANWRDAEYLPCLTPCWIAVSDSCIPPHKRQLSLLTDFQIVDQACAAQFCGSQYNQGFAGTDLFRARDQQIALATQRHVIDMPATRIQSLNGLAFQRLDICAARQNIGLYGLQGRIELRGFRA